MRSLVPALMAFFASLSQHGEVNAPIRTTPSVSHAAAARAVPFGVGEKMEYEAKFSGVAKVGKSVLQISRVEMIRGRPAWNVEMSVSGGIPLVYKVNSLFESWMDTLTLNSLRFSQDQEERGKSRERLFDIFPERAVFRQRGTPDTLPEMPSVSNPLDEASFLYFIRTTQLEVGQTYTFDRYFRPDRNPVIVKVLGKEKLSVPAIGIIDAIVIQPTIRTSKLFADGGEAKIWLSDDPRRMLLKLDTKLSIGRLQLNLTRYTPPKS